MICKVKASIKKYSLISDDVKSVAVGFSGGADSVCLLHILNLLKDEYGISLKAVHVNHCIRGDEADADEKFVRSFCNLIGVELFVFKKDIPVIAKKRKISLEECGRQVRYECFNEVGCDVVAVAHTLSDSIETMLFNLARGTGSKGLSGINPKRHPGIIRPLIDCTRKEIEEYCESNSLKYVVDSTNLSDDYTRNHIRHNIVPAFEKINGDFESAFLRAMCSVREENDYIEICVKKLLDESRCNEGFYTNKLASVHDVILKRCILEILKNKMNKPPEAKHIELCYEAVKSGKGKIEVGKDLYLSVSSDIISFCRNDSEFVPWKASFEKGVAHTPFGTRFVLSESSDGGDGFDFGKTENELFLSSRIESDKFTFSKRGVTKSLKKLFNELKIPLEKRGKIAVLHDGENVVWIEDIGVNSMYIPNKNSQKIIYIKKDG